MAVGLTVAARLVAGDSFAQAMAHRHEPVARALVETAHDVGEEVKQRLRGEIGAAGFSRKWQNALRVDVYPRRGVLSLEPAIFAYHRIPYARVFGEGATIRGEMYLPLKGTPKRLGKERMTPEVFTSNIGDLVSVRKGGRTLLLAPAALGRGQAGARQPKVSLAALRRGERLLAERRHARRARTGTGSRSSLRFVPLFVEVRQVTIPQKFDFYGAIAAEAAKIPGVYAVRFRDRE